MCLFALDNFESLEPLERLGSSSEQPVQVMFKQNYIKFGSKGVPLQQIDGMPCVVPEILSGVNLASG